jgi:hypothetical protein
VLPAGAGAVYGLQLMEVAVISNLTIGTTYWFDLQFFTNNALDQANINACEIWIEEI